MRKIKILSILLFCYNIIIAQNLSFRNTFDLKHWALGPIMETADGGIGVSGWTDSSGAGSYDFDFMKLDSNGNVLWHKTYGTPENEQIRSWYQLADGGFALVGVRFIGTVWRIYVVRIDSIGNLLWSKTYVNWLGDGVYIRETFNGELLIISNVESIGAGLGDILMIRTDSLGNVINAKTYGTSENERIGSADDTNDGGVVVVGETDSGGCSVFNSFLLKLDNFGNEQWEKIIEYDSCLSGQGYSVIQTADGGYFMGLRGPNGGGASVLIRFNSMLSMDWCKTFSASNNSWHEPECIKEINGDVIFTDYVFDTLNSYVTNFLTRIDFSGNIKWSKYFSDPSGQYHIGFEEIGMTSDSNLLISGAMWDSSDFNMYIQKFPINSIDNLCDVISIPNTTTSVNITLDSIFVSNVINNIVVTNINTTTSNIFDTPTTICLFTNIPEPDKAIEFNISPNPFNEELTVNCEKLMDGKAEVKLYDIFGHKILSQPLTTDCKIKTENLSNGVYFVNIFTSGKVITRKVVKSN